MKKISIIIILLIAVLISLMSCGNNTQENIDYIIGLCDSSYFTTYTPNASTINDLKTEYENDMKTAEFEKAVISKINSYCEKKEWSNVFMFLYNLNILSYSNTTLKDSLWNDIKSTIEQRNDGSADLISEYIYYCSAHKTFENCPLFPRKELINYFKTNGIHPDISENGYYNQHKDEYKYQSEFVSPVGMDTVGTYTEETSYYYHGDILFKYYRKRWYGTSSNDKNNSSKFYMVWRNSDDKDIIIYGTDNKNGEAKKITDSFNAEHIYIIELNNTSKKDLENINMIEINGTYIFGHASSFMKSL